jgi:predicted DNA-binding transcriptional regulator AlpA
MAYSRLLMALPDAQEILGGTSRSTIYELIGRGELIKVNIGRRAFITSESIEKYVQRLSEGAAKQEAATVRGGVQ